MNVVTATDEALADVIEAWLHSEIPDDQALTRQMAGMAMSFRSDGATVDETCEWTRILVRSWLQHPSHRCERRHLKLVTASEVG